MAFRRQVRTNDLGCLRDAHNALALENLHPLSHKTTQLAPVLGQGQPGTRAPRELLTGIQASVADGFALMTR